MFSFVRFAAINLTKEQHAEQQQQKCHSNTYIPIHTGVFAGM